MFLFHTAQALANGAPARGPGGSAALLQSPLTMLFIIFIIFYFLIIRPQQKKQRDHQNMLRNLKIGDKVLTNGGIYGKVITIADTVVTLQVDDRVKIRVARSAIAGLSKE